MMTERENANDREVVVCHRGGDRNLKMNLSFFKPQVEEIEKNCQIFRLKERNMIKF